MLQIQDDQEMDFEMGAEIEMQTALKPSQLLRDIVLGQSSKAYQLFCRLGCDEQSYQSFNVNLKKIDSTLFINITQEINKKLSIIIQRITLDFKLAKDIQTFEKFLKFFQGYFRAGQSQIKITQQLQQLALKLLASITLPEAYYRLLLVIATTFPRQNNHIRDKLHNEIYEVYNFFIGSKEKNQSTSQIVKVEIPQQMRYILSLRILKILIAQSFNKVHEDNFEAIVSIVFKKPYKKLLKEIVAHQTVHELCDRIIEQLLSCMVVVEQSKLKYKFRTNKLHPDLLNQESVEMVLKQTNMDIIQYLTGQSIIVQQNSINCKYSLKMLEIFKENAKKDETGFEIDNLYNIAQMFKKLLENENKPMRVVTSNQMEEQNIYPEYISLVFQIMSGYIHNNMSDVNGVSMQGVVTELHLQQFLKMISKWIKQPKYNSKQFITKTLQLVYMFSIFVSYRRSFQNINKFQSPIAQLIASTMLQVQFPFKWQYIRYIKSLLVKWSETLENQNQIYSKIVYKFLNKYFDQKIVLPTRSTRYISEMFVSRVTAKIYIQQTKKQLLKIQNNTVKNPENHLEKVLALINTKQQNGIKQLIDSLANIYENHAHSYQMIYHYRTWIMQNLTLTGNTRSNSIMLKLENIIAQFNDLIKQMNYWDAKTWLSKSQEISEQKIRLSFETLITVGQNIINSLELKSYKQLYQTIFFNNLVYIVKELALLLNYSQNKILSILKDNVQFKNKIVEGYISGNSSNYRKLQRLYRNLKNIIRLYICNGQHYITKNQQYYLMKEIGSLYLSVNNKSEMTELNDKQKLLNVGVIIKLLNDIMGFNKMKNTTHLQKQQIFRPNRLRYNNRNDQSTYMSSLKREQYMSMNLYSSFYCSVKSQLFETIKTISNAANKLQQIKNKQDILEIKVLREIDFNKLVEHQKKQNKDQNNTTKLNKQFSTFLQNVMFTTLQVQGGCWVNEQYVNDAKDDIGYGIFYHQFETMITILSYKEVIMLQSQIQQFLLHIAQNNQIVTGQQRAPMEQFRHQHRRPQQRQRLFQQLRLLSYPPEIIHAAVENNDFAEVSDAIEWIQANPARIEQFLLQRVSQQSRINSRMKPIQALQPQILTGKIVKMNAVTFNQNLDGSMKNMIKNILFPNLFSKEGEKIKNILFVCLNAFKKQQYKSKQYVNFATKMFSMIDEVKQINQDQFGKLKIILSILDATLTKQQKIVIEFYAKQIGIKILALLPKVTTAQGNIILKIINNTLPNSQSIQQNQKDKFYQYMSYICDCLLQSKILSGYESQILYKIISTKQPNLIKKAIQVMHHAMKAGNINNNIFSLVELIFQSNNQFCKANIQLDIKGYILENYGYKQQGQIQIQGKFFSVAFGRYEGNKKFIEVSQKLLTKKKNKNRMLYYNCKQNNLLSNSKLLLPQNCEQECLMVESIINQIVENGVLVQQMLCLKHLQKILTHYKLLIPYAVTKQVTEGKDFLQWLLSVFCLKCNGSCLPFIQFLLMNNNLFVNEDLESFAQYVIARLLTKNLVLKDQSPQDRLWILFFTIYLLQIKKFMKNTITPINGQNQQTLLSIIQNLLSTFNLQSETNNLAPIEFSILTQCVYLINKWNLIQKLSSKYKIIESNQTQIQKQYINCDLFYKEVNANNIRHNGDDERGPRYHAMRLGNHGMNYDLVEDQQEQAWHDEMPNIFSAPQNRLRYLSQDNNRIEQSRNNIFNIFQPIQQKKQNPVDKIEQQVKQQEPIIQEQPAKKIKHLTQIIAQFESFLPKYKLMKYNQVKKQLAIINLVISIQNIPQTNLKINQVYVPTDFNSPKTKNFQLRISQIFKLITINTGNWDIPGQQEKKKLTLKIGQSLLGQRLSELRQEMMMFLERELQRRQQQQDMQQIQRQRPLNLGQLMGQITQTIQPQIQKQPPVEIKQKQQQKRQKIVQQKHEQKVQEPEKMQIEEKQEKKQLELKQEKQQIKQQKPKQQEKKNDLASKQQRQLLIPITMKNEEIQQKVSQTIEKIQQQPKQQKPIQIKDLQNVPNENIAENFQHIPNEIIIPEQRERQRQILTMMGLPQTFLQDVGLDAQLFDQLPEDLQIDQLTHFVRQQQRAQQANNPNNRNQGLGLDPISQNAALFASLDPTLRAQLLMETSPEILMTLPPEMRAQAQNARQRQIQRIIEADQYQQENQPGTRPKQVKNLIFPKISRDCFPTINQNLFNVLVKSLFLKVQKFKQSGYKILLENKLTQDKALTTLIVLLRQQHFNQKQNIIEVSCQTVGESWKTIHTPPIKQIKSFRTKLLNLIYDMMINCPYKDQQFLKEKISYQGFCEKKLAINDKLCLDEDGYYPELQIFDLSLNYHPNLAVQIIKNIKRQIPQYLLSRINQAIKKNKLSDEFYDHLTVLSQNQKMKQLFIKYFPENQLPKIQVLAKLIKYKFAQLPYLNKIHQQTLASYNPSYNEFLNQIFSIYKEQDIKKMEVFLLKYKNTHFQIIKYLYSLGRSLESEPMGIILKFPKLLDFQTKKFLFKKHPKIRSRQSRFRLAIEVNRQNILQESFNQIMGRTPRQLQGRLQITFIDQPGYDAGGIAREWFESVSKQIFNSLYALFEPSSSGNTYKPNPKSYVNPDHLNYFKFVGRFVGKALSQGMLIDSYFTRAFYKCILGQQLQFQDLEQQDFQFYKSMQWLKQNKMQGVFFETFSYQYDNFGVIITKDIIPNGRNIAVNEQNKQQYIEKYCLMKMRDDVKEQMKFFLEGFNEIIPQQCISFFEAKQLELLISGLPEIDIEDMKVNTDYVGFTPADQVIRWYWQLIAEYTQDELAKLIQFITGTSRIPAGGFAQLQGMNGLQRISIHRDHNTHQLPKSHTCFNQLDLPNYPTKQDLKQKMRIAITEGHQGFGFM